MMCLCIWFSIDVSPFCFLSSCPFALLVWRFSQLYFLGFSDFNNIYFNCQCLLLFSKCFSYRLLSFLQEHNVFFSSLRLLMIGFVSFYIFFSQHSLSSKLPFVCFWPFLLLAFHNSLVILGCLLRFKGNELNSCWEALNTWTGHFIYRLHCQVIWHGLIFRKAMKPMSESSSVFS